MKSCEFKIIHSYFVQRCKWKLQAANIPSNHFQLQTSCEVFLFYYVTWLFHCEDWYDGRWPGWLYNMSYFCQNTLMHVPLSSGDSHQVLEVFFCLFFVPHFPFHVLNIIVYWLSSSCVCVCVFFKNWIIHKVRGKSIFRCCCVCSQTLKILNCSFAIYVLTQKQIPDCMSNKLERYFCELFFNSGCTILNWSQCYYYTTLQPASW